MKPQMLKKLTALGLLALATASAPADISNPTQAGRNTIGQVTNMETKDGFSAQFWMTTDEQIFSSWTKPGALRNLKPIDEIKRNTPIYLALFVANPGAKGPTNPGAKQSTATSDVTFDLYVVNPSGALSVAYKQRPGWKGLSPSPGLVYLAKDRGTLNFEAIDPLGEYAVVVIIHDNVRKADIKLTRKLTLVE